MQTRRFGVEFTTKKVIENLSRKIPVDNDNLNK